MVPVFFQEINDFKVGHNSLKRLEKERLMIPVQSGDVFRVRDQQQCNIRVDIISFSAFLNDVTRSEPTHILPFFSFLHSTGFAICESPHSSER